ncbi:MAG TPA: carboxypeptidase regulatory-like domain-containing protein [Pyrinomonadaceae bacterium]|nr:carboxypeptidase regulatory-like domain-containing protein [Pyrinomonadaceae bacterium]
MERLKYLITCAIFLVLVIVPTTMAQTSKGFVVGTVTDPNGAAIAAANIKITNAATGVTRETVSQQDGSYRLDAVDPGTYKVEVSATGFKTATREVVVAAAQTAEAVFPLEVGNPTEVVTVTSGTGIELQTQDGARVNSVGTRQITELPVQGLNPVNLVFTFPGVVDPGPLAGGFVQGTEFSVNGLRARANNQLIDGLDNNDNSITGQFYQPVLRDGYNEVTVLQSDYSAEFGRAGGAVVNVITKSGTNRFHGSVYDVIIPSKLSALSPFEKAGLGLTKKPVTIENDYGFSLGGPIVKNKLFFFSTIQWSPFRAGGVTSSPVVPTAEGVAQLRALFPVGASANLDRYLAAIGDLRGTTGVFSVPLGGGRPSIPFGTATRTSSQPVDDTQYLFRVDWTPSEKDNIGVRYLADDQLFANQVPQFSTLQFPGTEVDVPSLVQNAYINWTHTLSPNTTNEFRFGYGRFNVVFQYRNADLLNAPPQILFGGSASKVTGIGPDPTFPQGRIFNNYQFQDTISHTMGDHTFRAGFDVMVQRAKQFVPINTRGTFTFTNNTATNTVEAFPAFGNFIDNFSGTQGTFASKVFGPNDDHPDVVNQAYFINDNWRARPNLTLNLGLRYELYGVAQNTAPFPAFCGFGVPLLTRCEVERDKNNFAPRFSFAYTPKWGRWLFGEDRTVLRGGFAVNYDIYFNNILSNTIASPPNAIGITTLGANAGGRGFANATGTLPTVSPAPNPLAAVSTVTPNLHNPKTYVWNLGVQRQLPWGMVWDVAYVGSRGLHLFLNEELNPVNPATGKRIHTDRGPIQPRTNAGDSNYHSLQTRLERGIRSGLLFRFAYTWSKAIDDVNSEVFVTSGGSSRTSDLLNLFGGRRADRSVASFDVPHAASLTFLYDVPSLSDNRFVRGVTSGFTLSGIWRIQSGAPETAYLNGFDINGDGVATNDRPALNNPNAPRNSVAIFNDLCDVASPTGYCTNDFVTPIALNDARFVVDPNIRTGIVGRNTLRAPTLNRFDVSLMKSIKMPWLEDHRFEIRMDFFNVFNHPIFTWDAASVGGLSDGDVFNQFFNQPELNGGPNTTLRSYRSGRIQLRYVF